MENMLKCGLKVGWAEVIRQTVSFLLVCVCVCGGEGGLVGHDKASNVALAAKSFTIICTIVKYSLPVS